MNGLWSVVWLLPLLLLLVSLLSLSHSDWRMKHFETLHHISFRLLSCLRAAQLQNPFKCQETGVLLPQVVRLIRVTNFSGSGSPPINPVASFFNSKYRGKGEKRPTFFFIDNPNNEEYRRMQQRRRRRRQQRVVVGMRSYPCLFLPLNFIEQFNYHKWQMSRAAGEEEEEEVTEQEKPETLEYETCFAKGIVLRLMYCNSFGSAVCSFDKSNE